MDSVCSGGGQSSAGGTEQCTGTHPPWPPLAHSLPFHIEAMTLQGLKFDVVTVETDTIWQMKCYIEAVHGIAAARQRVIYAGRVLDNRETVGSCDLHQDTRVHLVVETDSVAGAEVPNLNATNDNGPCAQSGIVSGVDVKDERARATEPCASRRGTAGAEGGPVGIDVPAHASHWGNAEDYEPLVLVVNEQSPRADRPLVDTVKLFASSSARKWPCSPLLRFKVCTRQRVG